MKRFATTPTIGSTFALSWMLRRTKSTRSMNFSYIDVDVCVYTLEKRVCVCVCVYVYVKGVH